MTRPYRRIPWDGHLHPVQHFRVVLDQLDDEADWPAGTQPVKPLIDGTAFFSASWGLVIDSVTRDAMRRGGPPPPFPHGGVMFVGHNIDGTDNYMKRVAGNLAHGDPDRPDMVTWKRLYQMFDMASIPRSRWNEFFFTNAFVGLKQGKPGGSYPGRLDPTFVSWCRSFLNEQMAVMEPSLVVTLGTPARAFVEAMKLGRPWMALEHPSSNRAYWRLPDGRRVIEVAADSLEGSIRG